MIRNGIAIMLLVVLLGGCASPYPIGVAYTEWQAPHSVVTQGDVAYTKVGVGKVITVLGLVAIGDASMRSAIRDGQISEVKYVDYSARNIMGIYGEYIITVYGD
ncbi:TRL domain-containing protein [Candidatus Omnitrophota bacterium]